MGGGKGAELISIVLVSLRKILSIIEIAQITVTINITIRKRICSSGCGLNGRDMHRLHILRQALLSVSLPRKA